MTLSWGDQVIAGLGDLASNLEGRVPFLSDWIVFLRDGLLALPSPVLHLLVVAVGAVVLLGLFVSPLAGFSTYVERRVAGRMQARIGCNRVGPEGLLQFMADGLKLVLKEDTIPAGADRPLFRLSPYLVIAGAFLGFVCIPFGTGLVAADLNLGIFYLLAVSSLVVIGILLAGWSSNNKWSLLGAMRSAAQMVSYEIPLGLALMVPVLLCGSLNLQDLNLAQAGGVENWFLFAAFPAAFLAFGVYFVSALAEANRTPFDLPEAESELVAGFATEYSGMRWGLFFVAEYANLFLIGAIAVTAFLGGYQPSQADLLFGGGGLFFVLLLGTKSLIYLVQLLTGLAKGRPLFYLLANLPSASYGKGAFVGLGLLSLLGAAGLQQLSPHWAVQLFFFVTKAYFLVFVMIWLRWTLPRYRVDQLMNLAWKKLIPISLFSLFLAAVLMLAGGWKGLFS